MCLIKPYKSGEEILIDVIKIKYSEVQPKFELLSSEVVCCARQIKIWMTILHWKKQVKTLNHESFWGWIQKHSVLRTVAVDGTKILKDTKKYLGSVLSNVISPDLLKKLIKNSGLKARLKKLGDIIGILEIWRHKRYAHLDNEDVANVECNLQNLYFALANLDDSLSYIAHFLLNPVLIISEEWNAYVISDADYSNPVCSLESLFDDDPTIQDCNKLLREVNTISVEKILSEAANT